MSKKTIRLPQAREVQKLPQSAGKLTFSLDKSSRKLLADLRVMIESARRQVARAINAGLTLHYWNMGRRIRRDILKNKRAKYGERIVTTVSSLLVPEYGEGVRRTEFVSDDPFFRDLSGSADSDGTVVTIGVVPFR